jgi:hypothetical protein
MLANCPVDGFRSVGENALMKKVAIKKPRKVVTKTVQAAPSKPTKTGLSKSDPEYYRKIGIISAEKRRAAGTITSEQLSEWAKKSHAHRKDYSRGGYRREARLRKELKAATEE